MVILFTGIAGLDSGPSLKDFISRYSEFTEQSKPVYLKIETFIDRLYRTDKEISAEINHKKIWGTFLREPYKIQEKYWQKASELITNEIKKPGNRNKNIFLNMHTCYYHRKTLEYYPLLSVDFIQKLTGVNKIITLIDDIYDIHERLRKEPDDIFYPSVVREPADLIFEYLTILNWRAKEIMLSRFLSKILNCQNYIFSIKHSWSILYNLIFDKKPTVYLSHPISEVRRLEKSGNPELAEKVTQEIQTISEKLTENFVPFLPTTIDEFRIKKEKKEKNEIFYTVLSKRWNEEKYLNPQKMLFGKSGFTGENELWQKEKSDFPNKDFNLLLKTLHDSISTQVTIRDYALVEQSKYLVVYRPLFNGNASGGVEKESEYHKDLVRALQLTETPDTTRSICFVYCPKEDIEQYKRKTFNYFISQKISLNEFVGKETTPFQTITDEEFLELIDCDDRKDRLVELLKRVLNNHKIQISNSPNIADRSPLKDNEEIVDNVYAEMIEAYQNQLSIVINFYKQFVSEFPEHNIFDVHQFISKIKEEQEPIKNKKDEKTNSGSRPLKRKRAG